jgi:hypothetical protein
MQDVVDKLKIFILIGSGVCTEVSKGTSSVNSAQNSFFFYFFRFSNYEYSSH